MVQAISQGNGATKKHSDSTPKNTLKPATRQRPYLFNKA